MTIRYADHVNKHASPQSEPIPGETQVANHAGGYAYAVDKWQRLTRFLILGSDGGTFYIKERALTRENAAVVEACLADDAARTIKHIVEISDTGRAPKNDPAILALAIAASVQNPDAQGLSSQQIRADALGQLKAVCRIPTHLFHFIAYCKSLRRWSRMLRSAVADWYGSFTPDQLAYELVKYQARDGWSHRDVLRLSHAKLQVEVQTLLRWVVTPHKYGYREVTRKNAGGRIDRYNDSIELPSIVVAFEQAKTADVKGIAALVRAHGLTREMLPTEALNSVDVWAALLAKMPLHALVRNLAKMTVVGLIAPLSDAAVTIASRLRDADAIRKSRLHPMAILNALRTYASGCGERGSLTWTPVQAIVDALDAAFYLAFGNVLPTRKRILLALDVSGSMSSGIAGTSLSCREAAAALALVTANVEPHHLIVGFTGAYVHNQTVIAELAISPRQRLDDVVRYLGGLPFGATDCALPMICASEKKLDVDAFIVLTDSETWCGAIHPKQALANYRRQRVGNAKQIIQGMTSTEISIADPSDPWSLDVVGFDLATPQAISEFIAS